MNCPYRVAIACWFSAASLVFPIEKGLSQASFNFNIDNSLQRVLGSATEAIGDTLFLKADSYFHGGVTEKFHEEGESLRTAVPGKAEQEKETEPRDWIAKINYQVTSHTHRHLSADKIQELLPFFALSTTLNPHNVEALLSTAFWLDKSFSRTDEAIDVLKKGVDKNPASWELESELGKLYFFRKKDAPSSEAHFLEAIRKSSGQEVENFKRLDMHYFLAQAYEEEGKKAEALASYQEALKYFDEKNTAALKEKFLEKIKNLTPPYQGGAVAEGNGEVK